jgi:hypothetical protein
VPEHSRAETHDRVIKSGYAKLLGLHTEKQNAKVLNRSEEANHFIDTGAVLDGCNGFKIAEYVMLGLG